MLQDIISCTLVLTLQRSYLLELLAKIFCPHIEMRQNLYNNDAMKLVANLAYAVEGVREAFNNTVEWHALARIREKPWTHEQNLQGK